MTPSSLSRTLKGERIHQAICEFVLSGKKNPEFAKQVDAADKFMSSMCLTDRKPEVSFCMSTSLGNMNGRIDLLARSKEQTVIVDWKTVLRDRDLPDTRDDGVLLFDDAQITSYIEWVYREGHHDVIGYRVTISDSGRFDWQFLHPTRIASYQMFAQVEHAAAQKMLLDHDQIRKMDQVHQNCIDADNCSSEAWQPR